MTGVLTQFWAGAGYDLATGLGSVNALNLFQQWPNAVLPTVTTTNATAITATSASLSGTVNPNGLDTQVWFRYSTDINLISNVTTTSAQDMGAGSNPESFNYPASGLTAGTTYYFQANAQNAAGPSAGTTVGFVTSSNTSTYTLEVIDSGQGTITSSDGRINCNYNSGTCNATYSAGSVVSLSESPAAGWTFSTWGGNCTGAGSCILTMNSNQYAYATFTQNSASYTLTVGESGQGTVTSNVGGINCVNGSGTCSAVFNSGTSVTLSASPATNWTFSGWSGASCAGAGTCTVAMNANQSVTASFSENATSYTLTVAVTGQGSITSADSLINCSPNAGTCSETRPSGTVVNLNAAPAGGWTFSSWSGYCSGSGSCAVPLTANRSVTATFTPSSGGFTISGQVTYNGVGLGDVTLSLTGLVTESTTTVASGNYSFTGLTAGGYNLSASLPGYTFTPAGWGISLYENLTANFAAALANYTLTVSESGQGSVASLDGGISCSNGAGQCSASYTSGTNVTLNASPASGWQFYGWSGACFGTGSCTLTMNSSQAVTAAFSQSSGPLVALPAFTPGIISTVAGNGTAGYLGDGGSPTSAEVNSPHGVAVDSRGTIYVADFDNNRVRAINTGPNPITIAGVTIQPGTIATVAGTGQPGFSGDGGVPSSAQVSYPAAIAVDSLGNIYIADTDNNRIRVINTQSSSITILGVTIGSGTIQTVAGNGTEGFSGDGGAATSAELANPQGVALDANSNLYIADWSNYRVRLVSAATGVITTLAGGGQGCSQQTDGLGDGCPASNSTIVWPVAIAIDGAGNVFVPDNGNSRIRAIYKQGTIPGLASPQAGYIYTIAGAGSGCSQQTDTVGDGCPSVDAGSVIAEGLAVDAGGSLYIADYGNARLRRIDHGTGIITTVAGNGTAGYGGDSGPATNAELSFNSYWYGSVLTIDSNGNLYFGDSSNNRVRLVSAVAAPATFPPTSLGQTSTPQQVALQNDGNAALYITSFAISGGNASDFALPPASNTCPVSPTPLAAGASCTFSLTFTPTQSGSRSSSLLITDNAATITQAISLNGTTPVAPTTTTTGATSITPNSATLTGTVNPNGLDTQVWFIYGTDPTLSSGVFTTPQQDQGAGSGPVIFNINVGSLVASTPYYFQGNASNSAGSTAGSILSFQTPASTFSISGQVTYGGSGLSGVTMALSGGASASVVTNSSGSYAFNSLAGGQTYTLTPSLSGYSFTPSSFSFGSLSSNQTANFTAALTSYSLTVSEVGQGTITSTDGRISCASGVGSCSSSYVSGNAVTLNASAVANWTFLGWTGPCTGRGSCSLTMNSNQTVTATFGSAVATLSPSSLPAFRSQLVGTPSAAQTVTLSNAGSGTLAITSIATSANFGESNNCAGSVAASGSCTINVTFSPSATGPLSGSLTITDNSYGVTGSTQSVALSGTGQDFTLTTASGSSTSATVAPGQPATYTLSATGLGGFSQSVTLACVGAPSEATCTVSPSTLTPGSSATNVTVTVTTTAPSVGAPRSRPLPPVRPLLPGPGGLVMLALALAGVAWAVPGWRQPATSRRRAAFLTLAARLLLILAMAACGGGGGGGGGGIHNAGTPAGTYTLTVTGTAGSGSSALSHSMTLTLTVS
jgi:sugar lactone lactonase YvrE